MDEKRAHTMSQQRRSVLKELEYEALSWFEKILFDVYTLWLFTRNDIGTSTVTDSSFALSGIIASDYMFRDFTMGSRLDVLTSVLTSFWFTWHLTLCFNLGNQRQPGSLVEDGINKPWRPIPAGRITRERTLRWQVVATASLIGLCYATFGGLQPVLIYTFSGFLYSERRWGDKSWWQRTILNVVGMMMNRVSSLYVVGNAAQGFQNELVPTETQNWWMLFCALSIATTIQVQDLRDQEGDAKANRRTIPLIIGDTWTRVSVAFGMIFWSIAGPLFWELGYVGYSIVLGIAVAVSTHIFRYRDPRSDHVSFRYVTAWWTSLYVLPVLKTYKLSST